jgi:hypothetical protein
LDISTATIVGQTVHDPAIVLALGAILTGLIKLATLALAGIAGRLLNTKLNVENSTWKQKLVLRGKQNRGERRQTSLREPGVGQTAGQPRKAGGSPALD